MMYNQQQRPAINKVQIVGIALTVAVVGGVGIRIHSFVENRSDQNTSTPDESTSRQARSTAMMKSLSTEQLPQTEADDKPQAQIIEKQTQIVIVVPQSPEQIDCIQHGGGMGCFSTEYTPNLPSYYSPASSHWTERQVNNRWERTRRAFYNVYF
ncbi:MAG: hypothetical protein AAFO04_27485 [Cyanobacteria bacterium J06592_8]